MITIQGQYNEARVFSDSLEQSAEGQIRALCDQAFVAGSRIRIMPDVHAGAGCTIGTTMTIADKIVPNLVGVDIGCGMESVRTNAKHIELQQLDSLIYDKIPSGFAVRKAPHRYADRVELEKLRCGKHVKLDRAYAGIGTLGSGNHFIEAGKDDNGHIYLVVHSGSRHLGLEIAQHYQKAAQAQLKKRGMTDIPSTLAYVDGALFDDYIHDMGIAQHFAQVNREAMMDEILKGMKLKVADRFTTVHNYIDLDVMILRKGAVSAKEGELLLIPINMRDGSLVCIGKGNDEWNQSAPHGAGRLMSRKEAKNAFSVNAFKKEMKDVYSTSISAQTLDECPMAYKSMEHILAHIEPTVSVECTIHPIYNFKAGDE